MTDKIKPPLLHRSFLLDGLRALYLTQSRFDKLLKEDSYTCGYREGFEDALMSIAQITGVAEDFEASQQQLRPRSTGNLTIYRSDSK